MKKFLGHLQNDRTPHERRRFAVQVAGGVTAFVFVVWLSTMGLRISQQSGQTAQNLQNLNNAAATLIPVGATTSVGY